MRMELSACFQRDRVMPPLGVGQLDLFTFSEWATARAYRHARRFAARSPSAIRHGVERTHSWVMLGSGSGEGRVHVGCCEHSYGCAGVVYHEIFRCRS
jgi:hypothetical protein